MIELLARYYDGQTAGVEDAIVHIEGSGRLANVVIHSLTTRREIARWPATDVHPVHGRKEELRVGVSGRSAGARLVFIGQRDVEQAKAMLPALGEKRRQEWGREFRIAGLATSALVSVILAYVFGVPLLASRIVWLIPPAWEEQLGGTVAEQIELALRASNGFELCDPDPQSPANQAITRFAEAAMAGSGSPFSVKVDVIKSDIPNAFALPGGQVYYFSALLNQTQSADEFAGVLAHELGHVVHRHGMEQLIGTAGTGALIGFILGDMTGISVAAGLGSALIDSRFSREAEIQADRYSAGVATRLAFEPAALPDLLDRVAGDDDFTRALALLSTHPLTSERRAILAQLAVDQTKLGTPFTEMEWQAIRTMCGSAESVTLPETETPVARPKIKTKG